MIEYKGFKIWFNGTRQKWIVESASKFVAAYNTLPVAKRAITVTHSKED